MCDGKVQKRGVKEGHPRGVSFNKTKTYGLQKNRMCRPPPLRVL